MTFRKKRILAFAMAFIIINSSYKTIKKNLNVEINKETKQEQLNGYINKEDLKFYYILETKNSKGFVSLSLIYDKYNDENLYEDIGEIISILPFSYFVSLYSTDKDSYSADDVNSILKNIEKNYNTIKGSEEVKKLELK